MAGVLAALFLVARSMRELQAIMALQDERQMMHRTDMSMILHLGDCR